MRGFLILATFAALMALPAQAATATAYTYDTLGRVSTVTYPNGVIVTYNYDPAGNRTQVVTLTP